MKSFNPMKPLNTMKPVLSVILIFSVSFISCNRQPIWTEAAGPGTVRIITNPEGQTLGYSTESGVQILTVKGLAFKDLNRNGKLDTYEDWRLPADERAKDLASQMTIEQIAGLMLYSAHQSVPAGSRGWFASTYGGKPYEESGASASDLTDNQKDFLVNDNLRHILITSVESPAIAAQWNNNVQTLVEGIGLGIPANNSSDPRHNAVTNAEYNAGSGGEISMWSGSLGLAATFDPLLTREFGRIASEEYRALGITTALSPQIDLGTEPRWSRISGTFGEDPQLSADMARAYVDGFQTSSGDAEISGGWGYHSVNAMVKHWPGGGPEESGRDGHFAYGKFAVYPGNNLDDHLYPFVNGAFRLEKGTGMASAVMPYYTISWNQDTVNNENVGNAYSSYLIKDLLRSQYGFDGVVCTDWGITSDESPDITNMMGGGRCWGVEKGYTVAERHYKIIMAGVDQFGGNNDAGPVIEAYTMGVAEHGEEFMRMRFEESAVRLLKNIFRTGLFENPYLDPENSLKIVGNPEFMATGYAVQLKSVVLLKNKNKVLPLQKEISVYVPKRYVPAGMNWFGMPTPESRDYPVNLETLKKYFTVTDNPEKADVALVFINSPEGGTGYDKKDREAGGNGYVPIPLQYSKYTAVDARDPSIAGGDPLEDFVNRTYRNKTVISQNNFDLSMVTDTRKKMKNKPVIVCVNISKPMVFAEFEKDADAIMASFDVQDQVIFDLLTGGAEPSGLLPLQMPADMKTVEEQKEDVPHDMECYRDSEGNIYDFAYGMNWNGVIKDARTQRYKR
jgi:beta-glucosidase